MNLRIILQPVMAIVFATIDGIKDAKNGKPVYFWALLFSDPEHRDELRQSGWKSIGKVFIIAIILDVIYQLVVHHWVYPGETLFMALILAMIPYLLLRGLANRLMRPFQKKRNEEI